MEALVDDVAPSGRGSLGPETEDCEEGLADDEGRELEQQDDDDDARRVGKQVAERDLAQACTDGARGSDEVMSCPSAS